MADRDQSGNLAQRVRVYRGPSLGWIVVDIEPERIAASSPVTVISGDSVILLTGTAMTVNLPDVTQWILDTVDNPNFCAPFDRSIEIIDFAGNPGSGHVINPFGSQKIMTLSSWKIVTGFTGITLRPLFNLSGWYLR